MRLGEKAILQGSHMSSAELTHSRTMTSLFERYLTPLGGLCIIGGIPAWQGRSGSGGPARRHGHHH
jgi:hypothetical protein